MVSPTTIDYGHLLPLPSETASSTSSDSSLESEKMVERNPIANYHQIDESDDFCTTTDAPFEKTDISHDISDIPDDIRTITAIPTGHVADELLVQNYNEEGESDSTSDFIDSELIPNDIEKLETQSTSSDFRDSVEFSWDEGRDSNYGSNDLRPIYHNIDGGSRIKNGTTPDNIDDVPMMIGLQQSLRKGCDNTLYSERYVSSVLEKQLVDLIEARFDSLKQTFVEEVRVNLEEVEENFQRAADAVQYRLKNIRRESNRDLTRWMLPLEDKVIDLQKQLSLVNDKLDLLLKLQNKGYDETTPELSSRLPPTNVILDTTSVGLENNRGNRRPSSDSTRYSTPVIIQQHRHHSPQPLHPRLTLKKDSDNKKQLKLLTPPTDINCRKESKKNKQKYRRLSKPTHEREVDLKS